MSLRLIFKGVLYLATLVSAVQVGIWAFDRVPPFIQLDGSSSDAYAGQMTYVRSAVRRDLSRSCSTSAFRYMIDSKGITYDVSGSRSMTPQAIRLLEQANPGRLDFGIPIPLGVTPGPAYIYAVLAYRCNPIHIIWPIPVILTYPVEILP